MHAPSACRCINGSTLLHTAAYFGCAPLVGQLLALGVDVNLLDYKGATPLHRAKDVECIKVRSVFVFCAIFVVLVYCVIFIFLCISCHFRILIQYFCYIPSHRLQ